MAKIPLAYPKIPGSGASPGGRCVAFEKLDGTNLHWVWDREFGWITFGTRRDSFYLDAAGIPEFHAAHPGLEEAPDLFRAEFTGPLEALFGEAGTATVFTEFFGPDSFAGHHRPGDRMELTLFDVQVDGEMVGPERFVRAFGHLKTARVVYRGPFTGRFTEDVRKGKYDVAEGVVTKGGEGPRLWMVKVKTDAYLRRLRQTFRERWREYWE